MSYNDGHGDTKTPYIFCIFIMVNKTWGILLTQRNLCPFHLCFPFTFSYWLKTDENVKCCNLLFNFL